MLIVKQLSESQEPFKALANKRAVDFGFAMNTTLFFLFFYLMEEKMLINTTLFFLTIERENVDQDGMGWGVGGTVTLC